MDPTNSTIRIVDDQTSRDRMRAADTDRERVAEQLRSAHAEGRLDLAEYDERVQQAWGARTYGELESLTSDLPERRPPRQIQPDVQGPHGQGGHPDVGRRTATAWAGVSVINLMIWAVVCLSTMSWIYPWWIWVAGPWGAMLVVRWLGQRATASEVSR
jgi:hypothetical protein